ncbi:hypothetical protein B296_00018661 [Ensete ventricosum]|uniref:Uncharacterized protein n=1 Tax=Ensete ventricosum TaxID=4639 RepID=A0A427AEP2_ENSVE|nr:hypothetical protein B296_00018661 [Ensete ventricosum]
MKPNKSNQNHQAQSANSTTLRRSRLSCSLGMPESFCATESLIPAKTPAVIAYSPTTINRRRTRRALKRRAKDKIPNFGSQRVELELKHVLLPSLLHYCAHSSFFPFALVGEIQDRARWRAEKHRGSSSGLRRGQDAGLDESNQDCDSRLCARSTVRNRDKISWKRTSERTWG